ncbi:hypothetical protein CI109_100693 [Kwoniella shandongensis]|uniref:Uncharacterized protein n=1 Tax=Kwoniella shandongensis TaxID=1734106 RepID=A0A5M6BZ11_9TREE|nr:uncharacterized protein CI109_003386 [Kwoniella shandongensis]KAA5528098.1 hypothetical protein CI109_003386 [Kwoniella shandongensis]
MPPQSALIIGASQGLGLALVKRYASLIPPSQVFATVRESAEEAKDKFPEGVRVIEKVDCTKEDVGETIVEGLQGVAVGVVIYVAGLLKPEKIGEANWKDEIMMYTICSIAPVFVVQSLLLSSSLSPEAKIILLTSEAGSITLRTEGEGGGMYGHHGSKAAGNMVGHLLSYDLKESGVPIAMIHPGFLKTDMTKNAGMEEFYDKMGAITPEEAAVPISEFVEKLDMEMSGKFWAPLGARGIGNAEEVLGKEVTKKPGPLELPW